MPRQEVDGSNLEEMIVSAIHLLDVSAGKSLADSNRFDEVPNWARALDLVCSSVPNPDEGLRRYGLPKIFSLNPSERVLVMGQYNTMQVLSRVSVDLSQGVLAVTMADLAYEPGGVIEMLSDKLDVFSQDGNVLQFLSKRRRLMPKEVGSFRASYLRLDNTGHVARAILASDDRELIEGFGEVLADILIEKSWPGGVVRDGPYEISALELANSLDHRRRDFARIGDRYFKNDNYSQHERAVKAMALGQLGRLVTAEVVEEDRAIELANWLFEIKPERLDVFMRELMTGVGNRTKVSLRLDELLISHPDETWAKAWWEELFLARTAAMNGNWRHMRIVESQE